MEKRYQVFISSTFQDLQGARQEVSQALLRADCFPAGMELFPAADAEQFEFIKTVIDQSDYYILISAGRYGSIHPETGLSYTEMEYDYAVETGKPVIRLLHKDPRAMADEDDEKLAKLMTFRSRLKKGRMVSFWESPNELGREVAFALSDAIKRYPSTGWIRFETIEGVQEFDTKDGDEIYQEVVVSQSPSGAMLAKRQMRIARPLGKINLSKSFFAGDYSAKSDNSDD